MNVKQYRKHLPVIDVMYLPKYEYVSNVIYASTIIDGVAFVIEIQPLIKEKYKKSLRILDSYSVSESLLKQRLKISYWKELEYFHKQEYDYNIIDEGV